MKGLLSPARLAFAAIPVLAGLSAHAQWNYPPTRTVDASDTYFGTTYRDPYRWLENLKAPEVAAWFKAQATLTDDLLAKIPARDALVREWTALDKLKPAAYHDIQFENGRVFYKKTLGGENVGKLYYRDGWNGAEKLLFDPGAYKAGVTTTIQAVTPSVDGRYVAIALTSGGAEWSELRVLDVATGSFLPEVIYPSQGSSGWTLDNKAFFYDAGTTTDTKSPDIELNRMTRLHVLGTDVSKDPIVFSGKTSPELGIAPQEWASAAIDESYPDYLFGSVSTVQNEEKIYFAPVSELNDARIHWNVLCRTSDNLVKEMVFHGDYAYNATHTGAPRYKVVRTRVSHPDWKNAETVVPEAEDTVQDLAKTRDYLIVVYSNGVTGRIVKVNFETGLSTEVKLPASGTVYVDCPDWRSNRFIVYVTSWTFPTTLYDCDAGTGSMAKSIFNTAVSYPGFDKLVADEVEVPGYDGAMIPLSIIHLKGLPMDGSSSCILEGYGAYGYSYTPYFTVMNSVALRGVVMAIAHVRGGGEKGEAWYKAGYKTTKPNTWKDFISCAEYLVKKGYTSPSHLGGTGTSAGGILISRAITERPDLFAAAVCNVGCANALRMEFSPNGPVNTPEFGTVKDPVECRALSEMDGVSHVVKGVKYPAVMGVGGWNDPRVEPWEPGKFIAALQNASSSGKPVLMKINYDDGHFTEDKSVTFRNFAGQDAFLLWQAGDKGFQPVN
jgi:prolyl oligopeptidase